MRSNNFFLLTFLFFMPLLMAANCSGGTPPIDLVAPSAPEGLRASFEAGNVVLRWLANSEADMKQYLIYKGQSGESLEYFASVDVGIEEFVIESVEFETPYSFALSAEDNTGNISNLSEEVLLTVEQADEASLKIVSYSPKADAIDVALNASISIVFSNSMNKTLTENALVLTPSADCQFSWTEDAKTVRCQPKSSFLASTNYELSLSTSAQDLSGNKLPEALAFSFTTGDLSDNVAPEIPLDFSASPQNQAVQLSWTANSETDLKHYLIYMGTKSDALEQLAVVPSGTTTYLATNLSNNTNYFFAITAVDLADNISEKSTIQSATPFAQEGQLSVNISGLPAGSSASVVLEGPYGFSESLNQSQSLPNLPLGSYTLSAKAVVGTDNFGYIPNPAEQTVDLSLNAITEVNIIYSVSSGSLFVAVTGLSPAAEADILVTGPNGFSEAVRQSTVLTNLEPGAYELRSQDATTDDAFFKATNLTNQSVLVSQGDTSQVNVTYDCQRVIIVDFKLANKIREELSKPSGDLTCQDMALLEEINEYGYQLSNLSGIQHAVNLKKLHVFGERVGFENNQAIYEGVSDLSPIRNLLELEDLYLHDSPITNLEALSGLVSLKRLNTNDVSYANFGPFANLKNLEELTIWSNIHIKTSDLTPLNQLSSLKEFHVYGIDLASLDFLEGMTSLEHLGFHGNDIETISAVASLSNLKTFGMLRSSVSDISALTSLNQLERVSIFSSPIANLSALSNKNNLTQLDLRNLTLTNTSLNTLAGLPKLERLWLTSNPDLNSISPLNNLTSLTELNLSGSPVTDFSALANLPNLTYLQAKSANLSSLDSLSSLSSLKTLDLSNNSLSSMAPLAPLSNLEVLDLSFNSIENLPSFTQLPNLRSLDLTSNKLSDINALEDLESIKFLYLRNNFITDISPLISNLNVGNDDYVHLRNNCLNLSEGSDDMNNISTLETRGARVLSYSNPQRSDEECD